LDVFGIDPTGAISKTSPGDGGQDIPNGYVNYDSDGKGVFGDDRPIDITGWTEAERTLYFTEPKVADYYRRSEGYDRKSEVLLNDKSLAGIFTGRTEDERRIEFDKMRMDSTKLSVFSIYLDPAGNKVAVNQADHYYITDDGGPVYFGKIGDSLLGITGINTELVYSSSLIEKGDVDVMVGPSGLRPIDKENVPSATSPLAP
jgi:hypothetical protein